MVQLTPEYLSSLNPFTYIGITAATYIAYKFTRQATLFLLPSKLQRYNSTGEIKNWALVTGATDGIGFGFAQELCARGFNVLLHGRNREKLERRAQELAAEFPERKTALVVLDAEGVTGVVDAVANQVRDVLAQNGGGFLSVLVNNVGGETKPFRTIDRLSFDDVKATLDKNVLFTVQITRVLLPLLMEGSGLVLNVSSHSSLGMPYISVYSSSKGFLDTFTYALAAECAAEERNVEVLGLRVGSVRTAGYDIETSLFVPVGRTLASSALNRVGCGRLIVFAYFWHWVQGMAFDVLPRSALDSITSRVMKQLKKKHEEKTK
ncbi:hypothetical protein N7495_002137 [Penicillium taxi]|uniref:uncharacterized protein n=1 Tax=Penicillium taxi TaxID=168475 RepID=UPI0025453C59|nr:uncharacterized protein N7495_002137 [Penicillium taxi]KAJ5901609.1 hypothetical protein N7495_002137 [Penicillium taxi]